MRSDAMKSGILCLAVVGALVSARAHAVGLGAIEVKSKLDQPFVAEIPLTINNPDEASGLVVRLASPEAFERVGMDPNQLSANLQFSIGRNARGEPVVRVTTPQRMNDPYVTFLVEADWGKGKMVREYTALLDPPHTASVPKRGISAPTVASTPLPAPAPVAPGVFQPVTAPAAPVAQAPSPVAATPPEQAQPPPAPTPEVQPSAPLPAPIAAAPAPEPLPPPPAPTISEPLPPPSPVAEAPSSPPAAAPAPEPLPPAPTPVAEAPPPPPAPVPEAPQPETPRATPDAITVSHGQTLSAIADQVRPGDVSVNRMMIALERANPDAFINDNINLLKSGAVLRIPASTDTQAITSAEANALVHEQVESWRQGAQPAPQLQPEETADNSPAKPAKRAASSATAAAEHPAAAKASAAPAATSATDKTATEPGTDATAGVPKAAKPRGAHLEIVPPAGNAAATSQSGASEGGSGSELRAQLAQTKEELSARNAEVGDLKAKVDDLEKMQKDSQQLLSMKDSQLAAMQQRLAELEKNNAASTAASAASESASAGPAASSSASAQNDATASASPASTTIAPAATAAAAKPATVPATTKPSQPEVVREPWYVQPFVLIGGGLLVLGGLLALMLRRPRQVEPPPRSRFDTDALAAGMTGARMGADAPAPAPVVVARPQRASQRTDEPVAAPAVRPVAAAIKPGDDEWAIPGSPGFLAAAAQAAAPAPVVAPAPAPPPVAPAPVAAATAAPNVTAVRAAVPAQEGHQTVATKLELARAYVDIGDADGARSMLEEVLIEGNAAQQQAAFELLDTLDS